MPAYHWGVMGGTGLVPIVSQAIIGQETGYMLERSSIETPGQAAMWQQTHSHLRKI